MKCPICQNELNENLECPKCEFINSIIQIDEIIDFFNQSITIKDDYDLIMSNTNIDENQIDDFLVGKLEKATLLGQEFQNKLSILINIGVSLFQKYKNDSRNIMNIHSSLARISEIQNLFENEYYQIIQTKIDNLKKKVMA